MATIEEARANLAAIAQPLYTPPYNRIPEDKLASINRMRAANTPPLPPLVAQEAPAQIPDPRYVQSVAATSDTLIVTLTPGSVTARRVVLGLLADALAHGVDGFPVQVRQDGSVIAPTH